MCGLVSVIARRPQGLSSKVIDIFEQMLILDTLRGKDSTGVMGVKGNGSVDIIKQAEQPYFMFRTNGWTSFRNRAFGDGKILAGHNRAATRGVVTNENAHPFYEKNIVLMHNGTLDYGWEKMTKAKVEVDSHAICHAMTEGTPQEVIPTIEGAFALLWYDMETERFHAVRNNDRTLCLITTADYYFLASESWMATIPLMREKIKVEDNILLDPGQLLSWDNRGNMKSEQVRLHGTGVMSERYQKWLASQGYQGGSWEDDLGEVLPVKQTQVSHLPGTMVRQVETKDCSSASTGSCALTSTSTTRSVSESKSQDSSTDDPLSKIEVDTKPLKVELHDFPKGKEVMVRILEIKALPNGAVKWTGKIVEPGLELLDAQGFLPRSTPGNEWPAWMDHVLVGKVAWTTRTVCGISVYVRDCEKIEQVLTHNGKIVPQKLWYHAHNHCTCRGCGQKVEDWEKDWTSVKIKGVFGKTTSGTPQNVVEMICPDCIMRSLEQGAFYDSYTKAYYQKRFAVQQSRKGQPATSRSRSVQDGEQVSGEPVGKVGSTIAVPGPKTVQ